MALTLAMLVVAAALEIGGDAAIRYGLVHSARQWLFVGVLTLAAYGFTVNVNRTVNFGRLMGIYIAVFFATSQLLSFAIFGERPSQSLLLGGTLIIAGGLVVQFAGR